MGICDPYAGGNDKERKKERKGSRRKHSPDKNVGDAGRPADPGVNQEAIETEALGGTPSAGVCVSGQLFSTSPSIAYDQFEVCDSITSATLATHCVQQDGS